MEIIKIEQDVCSQCKVLDAMLFSIPDVNERIRKVNLDHMENEELTREEFTEKFTIMATPTLLFLDEEGNELHRFTGVMGLTPDQIIAKIDELEK